MRPASVSYTHLKENKELFPVVTIIIMEAFINKMRRLKGVRKQLIVEAVSYTHLDVYKRQAYMRAGIPA